MKLTENASAKLPEDSALRATLENGNDADPITRPVHVKFDLPQYPDEFFTPPSREPVTLDHLKSKKLAPLPPDEHDERLVIRMMERKQVRDRIMGSVETITGQHFSYPPDTGMLTINNPIIAQVAALLDVKGVETISYNYCDANPPLGAQVQTR